MAAKIATGRGLAPALSASSTANRITTLLPRAVRERPTPSRDRLGSVRRSVLTLQPSDQRLVRLVGPFSGARTRDRVCGRLLRAEGEPGTFASIARGWHRHGVFAVGIPTARTVVREVSV